MLALRRDFFFCTVENETTLPEGIHQHVQHLADLLI